MRKKLLIGLALYLALGVVFGLVTDRQNYTCPGPRDGDVGLEMNNIVLVEVDPICFPIISTADRLQWVAITTPAWLPLVVRNVVRGDGVPIGSITLSG